MRIVTTAGAGRRHLYRAGMMAEHYDPPGIEFVPASNHSHDTEFAVAQCRADVGEELCAAIEGIEPLDAIVDDSPDSDSEDTNE